MIEVSKEAVTLSVGAWIMLFVGCIILYGGVALCLLRALKWKEKRAVSSKSKEIDEELES